MHPPEPQSPPPYSEPPSTKKKTPRQLFSFSDPASATKRGPKFSFDCPTLRVEGGGGSYHGSRFASPSRMRGLENNMYSQHQHGHGGYEECEQYAEAQDGYVYEQDDSGQVYVDVEQDGEEMYVDEEGNVYQNQSQQQGYDDGSLAQEEDDAYMYENDAGGVYSASTSHQAYASSAPGVRANDRNYTSVARNSYKSMGQSELSSFRQNSSRTSHSHMRPSDRFDSGPGQDYYGEAAGFPNYAPRSSAQSSHAYKGEPEKWDTARALLQVSALCLCLCLCLCVTS
jgi:hypothetical protein